MHPEFAALLHILLNNKAVLLLDLEKTDDALPLLREAVALSTPLGGIPLAEPRKNLARCLHMRGESGQAKVLYEEVLPVFVENYGDQHPKTLEVRRHLQELTDPAQ
ncbi:MAG: tetratricopeptide repeat protein [Clostridia bacterium]|nr:tetratricopeptide repeat protein [Clostridia bacterium]